MLYFRNLWALFMVLLIFTLWWIVTVAVLVNPLFVPPPQLVGAKLVELIITGDILPDITATILRTVLGFFAGVSIGIPLGILMGYYKRVYSALEFVVDFFRSIPVTALFPLFLLFFGIGDEAKIAAAAFATSLIILVNTMYGVRHGSKTRIMIAQTMNYMGLQLFRKIIFPESFPYIFAGLRIAVSISLIVVIVTEMFIGTTVGLGHRIINAQLVYRTSEMYAAIILAGIVGYVTNKGVLYIEKRKVHWSG